MEKEKFTNLINSLSVKATTGKWIPRYDKKLDHFYWTRKNISDDARLVKVSHEASLYYTPRGDVQGVFVEYMGANFIAHNPVYKDFMKSFTKKIDEQTYTVDDVDIMEKYLLGIGEALRADIYQDKEIITNGKVNFDELAQAAFN